MSAGNGIAIVSKEVVREGEVKIVEFKETHHASRYVVAILKQNKNETVINLVNKIKDYFEETAGK